MGCSNKPNYETSWEKYISQLEQVLNQKSKKDSLKMLSQPKLRPEQLSDTRVGVTEISILRKCGLFSLATKRNSLLGKQMMHSQRFLYEWQIITLLINCRGKIPSSSAQLNEIIDSKKQDLMKSVYNLLFLSREAKELRIVSETTSTETIQSFNIYKDEILYLREILLSALNYESPSITKIKIFEENLKIWAATHIHGILKYRVRLANLYLKRAIELQELAIESDAICPNKNIISSSNNYRLLVNSFYKTQIHTELVDLMKKLNEIEVLWRPLVDKIQNTPHNEYELIALVINDNPEYIIQLKARIRKNTQLIQRIFDYCNLGSLTPIV